MGKTCGRTFRRRKLKNTKNSPKLLHDDVYLLSKWICNSGYEPSKRLKPVMFEGCGRGLMADEAIYPDDIIISIPLKLLITPRLVLDSFLGPLIQKFCPEATGQDILSIFLMCEKIRGKESKFYPYIASLPKSYNIPAYFCFYAFSMIPKPVYVEAIKQCELVKNSYCLLKPLLEILKDTFAGIISFDLFKWSWCTVNTRSVFIRCEDEHCRGTLCTYHLALAPFLDLLNHDISVEVTAGFNKEKKCYEIISHTKFQKYSQVFINYGSHDSLKLFVEYGFVTPNNYNDHITFSLDDIVLCHGLGSFNSAGLSKRLKFIADNNLMKNAVLSVDGLSWNLSIVLKILTSTYDPKLWNSLIHQNDEFTYDSHFKRLKELLIKEKIADYNFHLSTQNCSSECTGQLNFISELCTIYLSILSHELSLC